MWINREGDELFHHVTLVVHIFFGLIFRDIKSSPPFPSVYVCLCVCESECVYSNSCCWYFFPRFPCVIRMSERMLLAFFVIPASSSSSVRLSVGSTGRTWTNEPISEEEEEEE